MQSYFVIPWVSKNDTARRHHELGRRNTRLPDEGSDKAGKAGNQAPSRRRPEFLNWLAKAVRFATRRSMPEGCNDPPLCHRLGGHRTGMTGLGILSVSPTIVAYAISTEYG